MTGVPTTSSVHFPDWARVGLSLLIGFVGYLVAGDVVNEDLRAALSALVLVVASAGIVPPTSALLLHLSPAARLVLTAIVTAGAYVINVLGDIDPTLRGVIVAVLALAASLGITPPQARVG